MRKLKKVTYLLFTCLFLISSFSFAVSAEELNTSSEELKANEIYYPENYSGYAYSVHTGMSKWTKLINHQDMVNACQIPEDVLKKMSTADLAQTVLSYPLNIDMYAYNTYSEGFEVVSEKFNGLKELKKRSDAANELLQQYLKQDTVKLSELDQETINAYKTQGDIISAQGKKANRRFFNLMTTELLLSQPVFIDRLTEDEVKTLITEIKKRQSQINTLFGQTKTTSVFVDSISQLQSKSSDNNLKAAAVLEHAYFGDFLASFYRRSITTPRGASVEVWDIQNDFDSVTITSNNNEMASAYPRATRLSNATVKYNCHCYAWYGSTYWMNDPFNYYGGSSPSYSEISTPTSYSKVAYWTTSHSPTNNHSGIVTSVSSGSSSKYYVDKITVTSKWGAYGLYQHAGTHCPYWYDDTSIRTRYYN